MRKRMGVLLCLMALLLLSACAASRPTNPEQVPESQSMVDMIEGSQFPAETPAQVPTEMPSETPTESTQENMVETPAAISFDPVRINDGESVQCDLDGDGEAETIAIEKRMQNEYMEGRVIAVTDGAATVFSTITRIESRAYVYLVDLEADGVPEIFLSGDMASDDYITYAWRYDSGLKSISFSGEVRSEVYAGLQEYVDGGVVDAENGVLRMGSHLFMLGTYVGVRDYALAADGSIAPVEGTLWHFEGNRVWVKTAREIPVTMEGTTSLPADTELLFTAADGVGMIWFETKDGRTGSIALEESADSWGWSIGGIHELDCFTMLPYAG